MALLGEKDKAINFVELSLKQFQNHFEIVQRNISPELLLATQISKEFFLKIEEYERVKILQDFENFFRLSLA